MDAPPEDPCPRRSPRAWRGGTPGRTRGRAQRSRRPSVPTGNVRPVATPGTPSRRTGHKPKYIQYEDLHPARREHAPDAAP
ncbi:hypothetical protein CTU88_14485 [Streptomyces sp. JV178]|nr:hypothetical protein CTU88_14485 [Streptomyces sp. JV178]